MATSQAFVEVVADTSNTYEQLDEEMSAILERVQRDLDAVEVGTSVDVDQLIEEATRAVRAASAAAPPVELDVEIDRDRLSGIVSAFGSMARSAGGVALSLGKIGAAAGAGLPVVAGLVAALQQMGPAAAVGASAMLTMRQATVVAKIAMVGVGEAIEAAMDPEGAEDFAEAIKKLSPEAAKFATAIRDARPALDEIRKSIQDRVFKGLADDMRTTAAEVMPTLKREALGTAGALNDMAKGVLSSARELDESGTLGKAMGSATRSLKNLSGAPGFLVEALGKVTAAAGPVFEGLTKGADGALDNLSDKLNKAFESGALQKSIETAVEAVKQLFRVLGNVAGAFKNIMGVAQESGGGLLGVLEEITGALRDVTSDPAVQSGFRSLFETMGVVAKTVAPLLKLALQAIGPVVEALAPPLQVLVTALGQALTPIIKALGPVLLAMAKAVGSIVTAFAPLLVTIGELIGALLPVLTPILELVADLFTALAPVIKAVAQTLTAMLKPILAALPGILKPILTAFTSLIQELMPVILDLVKQLSPSFIALGKAFGEVFAELGPVLAELAKLYAQYLKTMVPIMAPVIKAVGQLAAMFADHLAKVLKEIVVPALKALAALLRGDFRAAFDHIKEMVRGWVNALVRMFAEMPMKMANIVKRMGVEMAKAAAAAGVKLLNALMNKVDELKQQLGRLPDQARRQLSGMGGVLFSAGRSLIQGFIDGIASMIGAARDAVSDVVGAIADYLPGSPAKKGPFSGHGWTPYRGEALMEGFAQGIESGAAEAVAAANRGMGRLGPPIEASVIPRGGDMGDGKWKRSAPRPPGGSPSGPGIGDWRGQMTPEINVQVFIGDTELTQLIDTRVEYGLTRAGKRIRLGASF